MMYKLTFEVTFSNSFHGGTCKKIWETYWEDGQKPVFHPETNHFRIILYDKDLNYQGTRYLPFQHVIEVDSTLEEVKK